MNFLGSIEHLKFQHVRCRVNKMANLWSNHGAEEHVGRVFFASWCEIFPNKAIKFKIQDKLQRYQQDFMSIANPILQPGRQEDYNATWNIKCPGCHRNQPWFSWIARWDNECLQQNIGIGGNKGGNVVFIFTILHDQVEWKASLFVQGGNFRT